MSLSIRAFWFGRFVEEGSLGRIYRKNTYVMLFQLDAFVNALIQLVLVTELS